MSQQITRHNHYVPIWYQRRFISAKRTTIHYLDLDPPKTTLADGRVIVRRADAARAPKSCFWAQDLYTTRFGPIMNDEVERFLFGPIDDDGAKAVAAFVSNDMRGMHRYFPRFFEYLDAQKIRTPKGLDWVKSKYPDLTQLDLMLEMQHLRRMHCTMWLESVREIVSAERSDIKFIATDHPVTLYNPACPPGSPICRYPDDPSIALKGTQTIFPLDADHCLILTNLEYAKDPDGVDLLEPRQNVRYSGQTIARTDTIVRTRCLKSEDVAAINHVLKSRARRFIGAGAQNWLYPEKLELRSWEAIGKVLLPPPQHLGRFGGEIYIGYKDGTSRYQDAFGRTSKAHEFLRKKNVPHGLRPNDRCGCESGRRYKKCCTSLAKPDRAPWDVYSIRERNLALGNAVTDILGLNNGKTWEDVRREISDEQVKRIHDMMALSWPEDTNVADLLPRPDPRVFRALYMGMVDARTISASVTSWLAYFDEIVIVHPFPNPRLIRPEYSPVDSPGQHKQQTLKNAMLLIALLPVIDAGLVHLVPDPSDFSLEFGHAVRTMAKERVTVLNPTPADLERGMRLARDDMKRTTLRMPDDDLRALIREALPKLSPEKVESTLQYMRRAQLNDPFALLQPMQPGEDNAQLLLSKAMNLDLALYFAQLTGSAIYADDRLFWKHLAPTEPAPAWAPVVQAFRDASFTMEVNPTIVHDIRRAGRYGHVRQALRRIWNAAVGASQGENLDTTPEEIARKLRAATERAAADWRACTVTKQPSARFEWGVEVSFPLQPFQLNSVHRLLITSGRSRYLKSIPIAMFLEPRGR